MDIVLQLLSVLIDVLSITIEFLANKTKFTILYNIDIEGLRNISRKT